MASNWYNFSSITKKIYMALAGLFLIVFLLVHLGINLCLLKDDNGTWFKAAAGFMSSNYVIKVFEIVLFAGFIIHIVQGIIVQIKNWIARPVRYKVEGFSHTSPFSKFMIHTGAIVLVFIVIHLMNFYFVKLGWTRAPGNISDSHDFYSMAEVYFTNINYSVMYIIFMIFLGFHLNHAFQSAFQTLGLYHNKYTPAIKFIGNVYSVIVPLGFCIIPLSYLL